MPYPNEWSARLEDPDKFDHFRRKNDKLGSGVDVIFGILPAGSDEEGKRGGRVKIQAIRFKKDKFKSKEDVKDWLKKHDKEAIMVESVSGFTCSFEKILSECEGLPQGDPDIDDETDEMLELVKGLFGEEPFEMED